MTTVNCVAEFLVVEVASIDTPVSSRKKVTTGVASNFVPVIVNV